MESLDEAFMFEFEAELRNTIADLIKYDKLLKGSMKCKEIYHYTDANGLLGILQNQLFFATNAAFLNDSSELQYGKEIFIDELQNRLAKDALPKNKKVVLVKMVEAIEAFDGKDYYLICFSAHKDDLNQWVKYGDDGKGFSFGLQTNWLEDFFELYAHTLPVIYKREIQNRIAIKILDEIFLTNTFINYPRLEYEDSFYKAFANAVCRFCLFFKNQTFASEREYRVVISKEEHINSKRDIKFRVNADKKIIPYIETRLIRNSEKPENLVIGITSHRLEKMKRIEVKQILIGPKRDIKTVLSMKLLLQQLQYSDTKVMQSDVTLV